MLSTSSVSFVPSFSMSSVPSVPSMPSTDALSLSYDVGTALTPSNTAVIFHPALPPKAHRPHPP